MTQEALTLSCAMSGEREVLTVRPAGEYGVSFVYGPDASVIVDGDDLVRLAAFLAGRAESYQQRPGGPRHNPNTLSARLCALPLGEPTHFPGLHALNVRWVARGIRRRRLPHARWSVKQQPDGTAMVTRLA